MMKKHLIPNFWLYIVRHELILKKEDAILCTLLWVF